MSAPDEVSAIAYSAAVQVAAFNGVRGLLASEAELNPDCEGVCIVLGADGTFEVTALDASGRPVGGYRL
jgi:hypothetical protein